MKLKTLEQATTLGDAGQIMAIAAQHGYTTKHIKTVDQVFLKAKCKEFVGNNIKLISGQMYYIRVSDGRKSVWVFHKIGKPFVTGNGEPLRDITYMVKEMILFTGKHDSSKFSWDNIKLMVTGIVSQHLQRNLGMK